MFTNRNTRNKKTRCNKTIINNGNLLYDNLPNPSNGFFKNSDSKLFKDYEKIAREYAGIDCRNSKNTNKCNTLKTKFESKLKDAMNSSSNKIKAITLKSLLKLKSKPSISNINEAACNLKYLQEILNNKNCKDNDKHRQQIYSTTIVADLQKNSLIKGTIADYIDNLNNIIPDDKGNINEAAVVELFKKNTKITENLIDLIKNKNYYKPCD